MSGTSTVSAKPSKTLSDYPIIGFLLIVAYVTFIFWLTDLDIDTASRFYHPDNVEDVWMEGHYPFWRFFYHAGPIIILLILFGSLAIIILSSVLQRFRHWRIYAVFILLVYVLGPGLLVNTVFKDHWGRPRPDAVQTFGGHEAYVPPLKYNAEGDGKSFPSGHSSVGFALLAFWLIWRRRSVLLNHGLFIAASSFGILMGLSRMASGAHFLSDVLWSAFIPIAVMWALYFHVLNIPKAERLREQSHKQGSSSRTQTLLQIGLGGVVLLISLFNIPVDKDKYLELEQLKQIEVNAEKMKVTVEFVEPQHLDKPYLRYRSRGFGLPGNKLLLEIDYQQGVLLIKEAHKGIYSELNNHLHLYLPLDFDGSLQFKLDKGKVRMLNTPESRL